jgi:hypothetical protein
LAGQAFLPAFRIVFLYGFENLFAGIFFKIPYYMFKFAIIAAYYQMHMISHNHPGVQYETFVFLTVSQTLNKQFFVLFPAKHIYPAHHRKGYKMRNGIFTNFIFTAHGFSIFPE